MIRAQATAARAAEDIPPWERKDMRFRSAGGYPGFHLGFDDCPWIPTDPGCANKFMLFDLRRNEFSTLFRIDPGCAIPPHYHSCAVIGHVVQGAFRYAESAWIARRGSTAYEPAGEVHTLHCVGDEPMAGFFHVTGPHVTCDAAGNQIGWVDAFSLREFTLRWCRENGVDAGFVDRITLR